MNNDKIEGVWNDPTTGEDVNVHFGKTYRGHTWSDSEAEKLLNGETIKCDFKSKAGKPYSMNCHLGHNSFENDEGKTINYIGVVAEFANDKKEKTVPNEFNGHKFTEKEKTALEAGEQLKVDDLVSKKTGKTYSATLSWGDKEWNGHKFKGMIMDFN